MPKVLLAILANPPLSENTRTEQRVQLAANVLGYDHSRISNLFSISSKSSREIQNLGANEHGWLSAQTAISKAAPEASGILLAFGLMSLSGDARSLYLAQREWLRTCLQAASHDMVWQLGDARHPSRWHQYLSDRHGRSPGGSFDTRLRHGLRLVPVSEALGPLGRSVSFSDDIRKHDADDGGRGDRLNAR